MIFPFVCIALAAGASLAQDASPRRVEIDREASFIAARTGKAGLLGFLGHEHGVLATAWSAAVCVDPRDLASFRAEVTVPVEALRIDTAAALDAVGLERSVEDEQRRELQAKMTGPEFLAADQHPRLRFEATALELQRGERGVIRGTLTVHGVERQVSVPVTLSGLAAGEPVVEGSFEVLHTDHGMEPESIAGVVKVADAVEVTFRLAGAVTSESCRAE
jgi:polyisoprenoid-binding protein YceI